MYAFLLCGPFCRINGNRGVSTMGYPNLVLRRKFRRSAEKEFSSRESAEDFDDDQEEGLVDYDDADFIRD